jgi:hypothetical protein
MLYDSFTAVGTPAAISPASPTGRNTFKPNLQKTCGETTMLTITDLSARADLDRSAMSSVRGGMTTLPGLADPFFGITNAPTIDAGSHFLAQGQALAVDQSFNLGGLNLVFSDQTQNGVSGQVA